MTPLLFFARVQVALSVATGLNVITWEGLISDTCKKGEGLEVIKPCFDFDTMGGGGVKA